MPTDPHPVQEPFEDSRRLTGCNVYFADTGAALEATRGVDDAALERWRVNVIRARDVLGWPQADIVVRQHRSGASLAFAAPLDRLYAATEVNEWAWWAAIASPFSRREKVAEGRMRAGESSAGASSRKKLPFDEETLSFVRGLRKESTDPERIIWSFLRDRRLHKQKFRRQKSLGPYVLDFYCHELKLAIELDGGQHNQDQYRQHDEQRDAYVLRQGIQTLRYWNHDVLVRTEDVLADLWERVHALISGSASGKSLPSSVSALRAKPPSPGGGREDQGLLYAPGHAAVWDEDSALHTLRAVADAEASPALIALSKAARAHDLPFLADDDAVSIGAGEDGQTWAIDALPNVDAVEWEALHAIPAALVTGSNGKTTSVRLIAAMTRAQGWPTAHSCTDGVYFDGQALESGDFSGPTGARTALRQPRAQAAVLETARGGMLRRGLALCHANAALVTNVSADHFGEYGVHDLADLAEVKLTVARAIHEHGVLVLNADDPLLVRKSETLTCPLGWFALDFDAPLLAAHRTRMGATCGVRDGRLLLSRGEDVHDLGAIAQMPLTLDGRAAYNIANIAGAVLVAQALGVAAEVIAGVLARFGLAHGDNPGRLQHWRFGGMDVYLDYAHNPDGLRGLLDAIDARQHGGRFAIILGHAGNREDADLRAVAETAAAYRPELVVLKDIGGYERGRAAGEIAAIMRPVLLAAGVEAAAIEIVLDEVEAARRPLQWARDGDLVVLPVHDPAARAQLVALLDTLHARQWRPGEPLPPSQS